MERYLGERGYVETILHLLASIKEAETFAPLDFSEKGKQIYTYGDEVSVRLYKNLGFHVVDPESDPIERDGVKWQKLSVTPESTDKLIGQLEKYRSDIPFEEAEKIRSTLKLLIEHFGSI